MRWKFKRGLEYLNGGGDNDYDDLIFGFDLKLMTS